MDRTDCKLRGPVLADASQASRARESKGNLRIGCLSIMEQTKACTRKTYYFLGTCFCTAPAPACHARRIMARQF